MITKNPQKKHQKFYCKKCDYSTRDKKDYNKHLSTTKHKRRSRRATDDALYKCALCSKSYRYASGLSRHVRICRKILPQKSEKKSEVHPMEGAPKNIKMENSDVGKKTNDEEDSIQLTSELVVKMLKQQNTLQQQLMDLCKERTKVIHYQNCGNKKMTINVFLNEKCKDAMNLTDFVEKLEVSLQDLAYTHEHGYVKGISNIFAKHLTDLKPTERPIHCCDKKRLQFYVKDEDKWEKDEKNTKINKSIQDISVKQIKKLKVWEEQHPTYLEDDDLLSEWHYMLKEISGGGNTSARDKNKEQIKKTISETLEWRAALSPELNDDSQKLLDEEVNKKIK